MDLVFARAGGAAGVGLRMWKYGLGNRLARTALAFNPGSQRNFDKRSRLKSFKDRDSKDK